MNNVAKGVLLEREPLNQDRSMNQPQEPRNSARKGPRQKNLMFTVLERQEESPEMRWAW